MAYSAEPADMFRRSAMLTDKILKGEKPENLPIDDPKRTSAEFRTTEGKAALGGGLSG